MSTTHSLTMSNPRPEDGEPPIWQGYSLQSSHSAVPHPPAFEPNYQQSPILALPYHGRPQKSSYRSLDLPSMQQRPPSRELTGVLAASPPPLSTHHSYPSLKRALEGGLQYGESVHDFREDVAEMPKPAINQDHQLLSFGRLPDKHTILDGQARVQQIELQAQIHGMFFLSELATPSSDSLMAQPELTCYRRNLFQIAGNVTCPRGPLSVMADGVHRIPILSLEAVVSATESVDGHVVKLIVIPWKTPPPNSPELQSGVEHEPSPIPLLPSDEASDTLSEFVVYPIAYRRLQFRIATANNGRRRELQQHFTLHLNIVGNLANGTKLDLCETCTSPIVVRGRSPRNFQARKEIPLVGSSSARGQPPELHVATNMMQNTSVDGKSRLGRPLGTLDLPRSPFTFDSSNISGSPSLVRQSSYSAWTSQQTPDHTTPSTPSYSTAPMGMDSYLQLSHSNPDLQNTSPVATTAIPPLRSQYRYSPASAPPTSTESMRFIDSNPRPSKSPRHIAPPPASSSATYGGYATGNYSSTVEALSLPSRGPEYFPQSMGVQSWTSGSEAGGVYGTVGGGQGQQSYEFAGDGGSGYVKEEPVTAPQQAHYTWNPA